MQAIGSREDVHLGDIPGYLGDEVHRQLRRMGSQSFTDKYKEMPRMPSRIDSLGGDCRSALEIKVCADG